MQILYLILHFKMSLKCTVEKQLIMQIGKHLMEL